MSPGLWVVVAAVVGALGFGTYRKLTDGTFRGTKRVVAASVEEHEAAADVDAPAIGALASAPWMGQLGRRATLLQFSSAFCAPCRATRRVLSEVAAGAHGVVHIEVNAELHLDLVRQLGILRTPTTIVLDAAGVEVGRAAGAPRRDQVERALAAAGLE